VHDPYVTAYPGVPITRDLDAAVRGADAIAVFAGHREYKALDPAHLKGLTGRAHPVIVDGRNLVDAGAFIAHGFVYKGIGRGDANTHEILG
jgi:UDP-N-acetyl-D-mannosaminuronic acid dehydrogenase